VVFEADYDEIELQKYSYDVITITSSTLRHQKRHQNNVTNFFFDLGPSQSKFLAMPVIQGLFQFTIRLKNLIRRKHTQSVQYNYVLSFRKDFFQRLLNSLLCNKYPINF